MARRPEPDKETLSSRLTGAFLKPAEPGQSGPGTGTKYNGEIPETVAEREEAVARADDKERLLGLLAAPIAAALIIWARASTSLPLATALDRFPKMSRMPSTAIPSAMGW